MKCERAKYTAASPKRNFQQHTTGRHVRSEHVVWRFRGRRSYWTRRGWATSSLHRLKRCGLAGFTRESAAGTFSAMDLAAFLRLRPLASDLNRNAVESGQIDVEALGRELGVLRAYERLDDEE